MKINSSTIRKLIIIHIFCVLIIQLFITQYSLPWDVIYVFDIMTIIEFGWVFKKSRTDFSKANFRYLIWYLIIFTAYLLITDILNAVPLNLVLMSFRRIYRFYFFYLACAYLLTLNYVEKIFTLLFQMQLLNFVLTLYQYSVLGLQQDNLGGLFGIAKGANAYSNLFICTISIISLVKFLNRKVNLRTVVFVLSSSLLIGVLAELKIFFIELIIIIILAILLSKPSFRTVKITLLSGVCIFVSFIFFGRMFPEQMAIFIEKDKLLEYTTGTTWGYNISRFNAFSDINRIFFHDNILKNLFGIGFGNSESGSLFYSNYSGYNYTWFTHQVTFVETGYIGFFLYLLFYILIFTHATISKRRVKEVSMYLTIVQIMSVICIFSIWYNQSLRIESAYLAFLILSVSVVACKERSQLQTERIRLNVNNKNKREISILGEELSLVKDYKGDKNDEI